MANEWNAATRKLMEDVGIYCAKHERVKRFDINGEQRHLTCPDCEKEKAGGRTYETVH